VRKLLTAAERVAGIADLKGWQEANAGTSIIKSYTFSDFTKAFGFMARVAHEADKMDHHPEWSNVYNQVDVILSTHDSNGVTAHDIKLAQIMELIAPEFL